MQTSFKWENLEQQDHSMQASQYRFSLSAMLIGAAIALLTGCSQQSPQLLDTIPPIQTFTENGGWCWFQDERAIIHDNKLVIGSVSGTGGGDVRVSVYDLDKNADLGTIVLHEKLEQDDHNSPALFARSDNSIVAMYAKHFKERDSHHYYRISEPGNPLQWQPEQTFNHGEGQWLTYMNLYEIPVEKTLYCFYRDGKSYMPSHLVSKDQGQNWRKGGPIIDPDLGNRHRPYARYTANGSDAIHVSFTEAHPHVYGCSIYYAAFRNGNFYRADGSLIKSLSGEGPLTPTEADLIFQGDSLNNAWTSSIRLDADEHPHLGYSVYKSPEDHRYRYAWWDGTQWHDREIAFAGGYLYDTGRGEDHYTGLITLDPSNPEVVYISSDVDPATGQTTGTCKFEIYRGIVSLVSQSSKVEWQPITENSTVDNIRPVCVTGGNRTALLWVSGRYTTFIDYDTDIVGIIME
jgi:hypothetical protein